MCETQRVCSCTCFCCSTGTPYCCACHHSSVSASSACLPPACCLHLCPSLAARHLLGCALQGKLGQLVQLIQSMSFLTGGLAGMMAAFRPQQGSLNSLAHAGSTAAELASKQQLQQQWAPTGEGAALAATGDEGEVTVEVLIGCVLAAVEELPVWESTEVEQVGARKGSPEMVVVGYPRTHDPTRCPTQPQPPSPRVPPTPSPSLKSRLTRHVLE